MRPDATHAKLIYMANQIATFFRSTPEATRLDGIAEHINSFWEPRMRRQLFERVESGATDGIDPLVLGAMAKIRRPAAERPAGTGTGT